MTTLTLEGAVYAFALPDGGYGATGSDFIRTSDGRVEYPGEDVLFLVGTRFHGVLMLAGQGHESDSAWLWTGFTWRDCGPAYGVSPCAFGDGKLYISASPTYYTVVDLATGEAHDVLIGLGSQGIRYVVNGSPVSGDETYTLQTPYGLLHEYTRRGDVICGQSHDGDWALLNGRVLETGACRFIRLERDGDQLAVGIAKFSEHRAVLHWLTVGDVASLPLPETPPAPNPPDPPQETRMKLPADVHATFVACVQAFPHSGTDDDRREAMKKAVQTIRARHGLRYVWKSEHSNLSSPSKDGMGYVPEGVIVHGARLKMFIWDMINGTTRQPNPAGESEPLREAYLLTPEPKDWLATTPEPEPDPEPEPEPEPPNDHEERIATIELALKVLGTDFQTVKQEVLTLRQQFEHLPTNSAQRGDPVYVTGSVSIADALRSKVLTWVGKIGAP